MASVPAALPRGAPPVCGGLRSATAQAFRAPQMAAGKVVLPPGVFDTTFQPRRCTDQGLQLRRWSPPFPAASQRLFAAATRPARPAPGLDPDDELPFSVGGDRGFGDAGGPELDADGPIMADCLSVSHGAAHGGAGGSSGSRVRPDGGREERRPAKAASSRHAAVARPSSGGVEAPLFRERRLVVAALQPGEALSQVHLTSPPRAALDGVPVRAREPLLRIFAERYAQLAHGSGAGAASEAGTGEEDSEAEASEGSVTSDGSSAPGSLWKRRLRIQPWHRPALMKMLCEEVLHLFLQDRRQALGFSSKQPPLWRWEIKNANEHVETGQVAPLIRYLAETELVMTFGPVRRTNYPGTVLMSEVAPRLFAERKQLVSQWEALGLRLQVGFDLEDVFLRLFLDGKLSWSRILGEIGMTSMLEQPGLAPTTPSKAPQPAAHAEWPPSA